MATMFATLQSFLAEMRGRIVDIVPEHDPQIRFQPRINKTMALANFAESLRSPRIFELTPGTHIRQPYTGKAQFAYELYYQIQIWYPTTAGELWAVAADSDAAKIRHDIMASSSTVTAVAARWVPPDAQITMELDAQDPKWWIKSIPFTAILDITG